MLEARIEVSLCVELHVLLGVQVVDVAAHAEQPLENSLDDCLEVIREDLLVVVLALDPRHELVHVLTASHSLRFWPLGVFTTVDESREVDES